MPNKMETWKEFEANALTHSATHYLFAVYDLIQKQGYARVTDVSKKLGIARSSSSQGLHTLVEKGYLREDENKFIHLTASGKKLTEEILGKKRILQHFFRDILKVAPHQAEVDTCKIEHLISTETGGHLLAFILKKFWNKRGTCCEPESCPVCEHTCLKELMPTKSA